MTELNTDGARLLSAILRSRSRSDLIELPTEWLTPDELRVYNRLRRYVDEGDTFPNRRNTRLLRRILRVTLPSDVGTVAHHLDRLRARHIFQQVREPYEELGENLRLGSAGDTDDIVASIQRMNQTVMRSATSSEALTTHQGALDRVMTRYRSALRTFGLTGIPTGWPGLDQVTGGWQRSDLIVWAGRPSRGKSWLLLQQAYAAWLAGFSFGIVSMEMDDVAIMRRMLGYHARINPDFLKRGEVSTLARRYVEEAAADMHSRAPFHIFTGNFERTVANVEAFMVANRPDAMYIDAVYLLQPSIKRYGGNDRRAMVSDVLEELKQVNNRTGIPIICTTQFNRVAESRRRGRGRGEDDDNLNPIAHLGVDMLGETDVIGQVASHVLGIELAMNGDPSLRGFGFLKGREGEDGSWYCNYPRNTAATPDFSEVHPSDERLQSIANHIRGQRDGGGNTPQRPRNTSNSIMGRQ